MAKTEGNFILYKPKMQIRTFTLLKVFNLLIVLLVHLIKQGEETAKLISFQGHLIASLYKNGETDFF